MSWLDPREVPALVLGAPPLKEVICQVRFPSVLRLEHDPLLVAKIQDRLRGTYPNVEAQAVFAIALPGGVSDSPQASLASRAWRLTDARNDWVVAVASDFVALSTHAYVEWADFAARLAPVLSAVFEVAEIATTSRVGLRYTNVVGETDIVGWNRMIVPELLGWLTDPGAGVEVKSSLHEVRLQVDGSLVGFRYGILPEGHPIGTGYLVDVDCYSETPIEATAENVIERVGAFNDVADRFFFNAITPEGLESFEPRPKGG